MTSTNIEARFVYTTCYTGYDISAGQTFAQKMMEQRADGTFATFFRKIILGMDGGMNNHLEDWKPAQINLTREAARELAAKWNENGYTRSMTKEMGLENIDQELADREARIAARRAAREARRAQA